MVQPVTYFHYSNPIQKPFDAAVVIPTTCRPSLLRAVHSVFHQIGVQRIHTLIGIDAVRGKEGVIDDILDTRPAQHAVTVLHLGYSTSIRHGGIYGTIDGGALRTILTYAANSRYVSYLDDDNWIGETHIARLLRPILYLDRAEQKGDMRLADPVVVVEVAHVSAVGRVGEDRAQGSAVDGSVDAAVADRGGIAEMQDRDRVLRRPGIENVVDHALRAADGVDADERVDPLDADLMEHRVDGAQQGRPAGRGNDDRGVKRLLDGVAVVKICDGLHHGAVRRSTGRRNLAQPAASAGGRATGSPSARTTLTARRIRGPSSPQPIVRRRQAWNEHR